METPFLSKSTPRRGALQPSVSRKGYFYALPQKSTLLQPLDECWIFDRYYQIVKCFRDEDLRDRQPELTPGRGHSQ